MSLNFILALLYFMPTHSNGLPNIDKRKNLNEIHSIAWKNDRSCFSCHPIVLARIRKGSADDSELALPGRRKKSNRSFFLKSGTGFLLITWRFLGAIWVQCESSWTQTGFETCFLVSGLLCNSRGRGAPVSSKHCVCFSFVLKASSMLLWPGKGTLH